MRRQVPPEAFPIRAGQVWRDRDKRSPYTVTVLKVNAVRVFYARGPIDTSSHIDHFPKRFDFVSNPPEAPHA